MAQNKRKIEAINNVFAESTSCHSEDNINIDSTKQKELANQEEIIALQKELASQKEIIALQKEFAKQLVSEKEEIIESEKIEKGTMVNLPSGKVHEIVESELQCTICSDLLIKATTLSCSHTFCKYCLDQWKNSKRTCPICRVNISSEVHCLVIDNFIDKIIENSSEEVKMKRQKVKKERSVPELMASGSNSKISRAERRSIANIIRRHGNIFPRPPSLLQDSMSLLTLSSDVRVSSEEYDLVTFFLSEIDRLPARRKAVHAEELPSWRTWTIKPWGSGHKAPGYPEL